MKEWTAPTACDTVLQCDKLLLARATWGPAHPPSSHLRVHGAHTPAALRLGTRNILCCLYRELLGLGLEQRFAILFFFLALGKKPPTKALSILMSNLLPQPMFLCTEFLSLHFNAGFISRKLQFTAKPSSCQSLAPPQPVIIRGTTPSTGLEILCCGSRKENV